MDNNKRVILAVVLSAVILFGWQWLFPASHQPAVQPEQQTATTQGERGANATGASQSAATQSETAAPVNTVQLDEFTPGEGREVVVTTPLYTATFNTQGGILEKYLLENYKETIESGSPQVNMIGEEAQRKAPLGLVVNGKATWTDAQWSFDGGDLAIGPGETKTVTFTGQMGDLRVERHLTFTGDNYAINETVSVTNAGKIGLDGKIAFTAATRSLNTDGGRMNRDRFEFMTTEGKREEVTDHDKLEQWMSHTAPLDWAAISSNYFLMAMVPGQQTSTIKARIEDGIYRLALERSATFPPMTQMNFDNVYFFGPTDRDLLAKVPGNLAKVVNFGWFDVIAKPLLLFMNWIYQYVGNYGVAILLLTVVIKLLFWPLTHKSYKSMNEMKKLQPLMQKIKEKHGDDKQKMQQEIMQLYKTYKVSPAGGCLPMVIQIPVFFGLYRALMGAVELRHACFIKYLPFTDHIWLADLSAKDPYYITPLIMGLTMFLQQKLTPQAGDPMQQKLMLLMPVVFTFMFLNFPAGLVVYWLTNNVLSIGQQWMIMRKS